MDSDKVIAHALHRAKPEYATRGSAIVQPLDQTLPVGVRTWTPEHVKWWLESQGVDKDTVQVLADSGVGGTHLCELYYSAHRRDTMVWEEVGVYRGSEDWRRVVEVYDACQYLDDQSWMLTQWVRLAACVCDCVSVCVGVDAAWLLVVRDIVQTYGVFRRCRECQTNRLCLCRIKSE